MRPWPQAAGRRVREARAPRGRRPASQPAAERLTGPRPRVDGDPIAPQDAWGHDVLWWLDRMVRTRRPLVERMTLVWHDWFATSNAGVGSQKLMLRQNGLFRRQAFGNFQTLLRGVTEDPAMILWLSSADNTGDPNENYARELMEPSRSASTAATPSRTCASRRAPSPAFGTTGRTPGRSRFASTPSGTTRA